MRTPLYEIHKKLNARFTNFHGWEMPLQYTGIVDEVKQVRQGVGLFDISHMGRFFIEGKDALDALQKLTTNDVSKLSPGRVQYSLITNEQGGVKDDITLYMLSEESFFMCVNAGNRKKIKKWLERHIAVRDVSGETIQIALQGESSQEILLELYDVPNMKYYHFKRFGKTIVSKTGYTGEIGFEIYAPVEEGVKLFEKLLEKAKPCGLGARDVLRTEVGYPLYGHELSEEITPLEASLDKFVELSKEFVGKEAMLSKEVKRKLYGLELEEKGIPRNGYKIYVGKEEIGEVSSGTFSPTLSKGVALCFIKPSRIEEGREVHLNIRGKKVKAKLKKSPFYRRKKQS